MEIGLAELLLFLAGGYFIYNHIRLSWMERKLKNLPTAEDVAKEVLKVKIPLHDLPPEMAGEIKKYMETIQHPNQPTKIPEKISGKKDYIG